LGLLLPQELKQLLQGPHWLLGWVAWGTSCTPTAAAAAVAVYAAPNAAAAAAAVLAPFRAPECRIGQVTLQENNQTTMSCAAFVPHPLQSNPFSDTKTVA
jgi:hypothetical protein